MKLGTHLIAILVSQIITLNVAQAIQLVNAGFEDNPPAANGNNIGHPILPWVLGTGNSSNVVKQDGDVGITGYGSNGPHQDASGSAAGVVRHYLDITNGSNDFYQSFTSDCTGDIEIGGFFSTRGNGAGVAEVGLYEGVGTGGNLVGTSTTVNLPAGNSATDPWVQASSTISIQAGTVYSFVISMDNNMNFDEAFVNQPNCIIPGNSQNIPTLSQWSIFLLSLLLGLVAVFSSKKRQNSHLN